MDIEEKTALKLVLKLLAQREYFSKELKDKLLRKGLTTSVVEKTIEFCTTRGYLNDEMQTQRVVARELRKGRGPRYIALKLKAKGVQTERVWVIDQKSSIEALLPKLCKKYDLRTAEGRRKLFHALHHRGFETESILDCIREIKKDLHH